MHNIYTTGKKVRVSSPATVANIVCGFDILGLCLNAPADEMELAMIPEKKIIIHSGGFELPLDPASNTAGAPLLEIMKDLDLNFGFELQINKNIKPGSGIGSSAASAAGAAVAANHLLGNIFSKEDIVRYAMVGEKLAAGVKHADNVAPAIYGGITLVRSIFPLDIVPIPYPELHVTVIHPQIEVRTSDARQILRRQVMLKDAIKQWGNIAGLVAGLMSKDLPLISRSLEDVIIEPVRSILIPGFAAVKATALKAGALGCGISGSGPSIFMLSESPSIATKAEEQACLIYKEMGLNYHSYVTTINPQGVKILQ